MFPSLRIMISTLVCILLPATLSVAQIQPPIDLLITGGSYFDTQSLDWKPNPGIAIQADRIISLQGNPTQTPPKETIALADDQFVLPGLFDLHAHYNVRLFKKRREEFHVMPVVYLANGATATFSAGEYDPEGMWQLRQAIESGKAVGPMLLNSGPYFGRARPGWGRGRSEELILQDIDTWAERGVAGFKAKGIRPNELKVLIERAHHHGLTVTGHLESGYRGSVNPRDAIAMGIDRVEHFLGGDALTPDQSAYASLENVTADMPEIAEIIRLYVEQDIWFDATITAFGYFGERGEVYEQWTDETQFFTPYVQQALKDKEREPIEQFEKIFHVKQKTIKAFYDAGGKITLGTDHFSDGSYLPGFGVHRELHALVRSGIPPAQAIKIGSLHGAAALNLDKDYGSIETGKVADLYIVKGDPLQDILQTRNGEWVIRAGKAYRCAELLEGVKGKLGPNNSDEASDW